jgi:hypothetical protein
MSLAAATQAAMYGNKPWVKSESWAEQAKAISDALTKHQSTQHSLQCDLIELLASRLPQGLSSEQDDPVAAQCSTVPDTKW